MIRFREHKGSLSDSMSTLRSFTGTDDMLRHVLYLCPHPVTDVGTFMAKPCGDDSRIGWKNVHMVISEHGVVLGFFEHLTALPGNAGETGIKRLIDIVI